MLFIIQVLILKLKIVLDNKIKNLVIFKTLHLVQK